ncbi:MAG TPA: pilus assembly protein, partial [Planctomycetaceae bacterium]|nr:pilus assembly protein [Planctomycetaceae bacterium]
MTMALSEVDNKWAGGRRLRRRRAAATVELAAVAPVFFLLVFALIEAARLAMVAVTLSYAAHEGCRTGVAAGSTTADVQEAIQAALRTGFISAANVSISPSEVATANQGTPITVTLEVRLRDVSLVPVPRFLGDRLIRTSCTMT